MISSSKPPMDKMGAMTAHKNTAPMIGLEDLVIPAEPVSLTGDHKGWLVSQGQQVVVFRIKYNNVNLISSGYVK